jgi:AraC-like DNA-binding protein
MDPDEWRTRVFECKEVRGWENDPAAWSFLLMRSGTARFATRTGSGRVDTPRDKIVSRSEWQVRLHPGDLLVVPPAIEGVITADGCVGFSFLHFHFHSELLKGFFSLEEQHSLDALASVGAKGAQCYPSNAFLARRFRVVSERLAPPGTLLHRCQLFEVVGMFLDLHRTNGGRASLEYLGGRERVRALLEQIPRAELSSISVEELARRCGCSGRHLNRILKECLGCSFGKLKMELRLTKAASLLLSPGAKVLNVALDCGFSHVGEFSAKFRNRYGATPAVWRRQTLGEARRAVSALMIGTADEHVVPGRAASVHGSGCGS